MSESSNNSAIIKKFNEFLEAGQYRKTPERLTILNMALSFGQTFTIEQLKQKLEFEAIHVSRATIYNNIELLTQANILRKIFIDGTQVHYEKVSTSIHTHLICSECGKVKVIKDNAIAAIMHAKKYNAFTTSHYSLCVYGTCNACARKLKKQNRKLKTKQSK